MRKKRTTLKTIATALGLHVSTVSRALDPTLRGFLSDDVVKRVREAADSMGYRQNRMAYGLRTNRSMTIGVALPDIANVIFPPILRGVESVLEPLDYALIIVNTDNSETRERRLLETLLERGVDGVIHIAATRDDPAALAAAAQGAPLVTVNRRIEGGAVPYVVNDDADGVEQLVAHLYDLGHRALGHVAGPETSSTGHDRRRGFAAACAARGLEGWEDQVAISTGYTQAEGTRCMTALLERAARPTAVIAANDMLALGAVAALRGRGLRCPEDVSVTGFNDMPFLELIPPALTTVRIDPFAAGEAAARLLRRLMLGETVEAGVTLPVRLVARDSTRAPSG